jgi:cobalt/nickel transport protein
MRLNIKLWIGIAVLIILSPLGLILPHYFRAKGAWGEWGIEELKNLVGYIPKGLEKFAAFWSVPIPDYALTGWEEKGLCHLSFSYIISAVIGIAVTVILVLLIGKRLSKKDDGNFKR